MICTIYVVRHGQSTDNRDDIVSGHVNPALTELGREQAAATRDKLAHIKFDVAYSSDLQRAADTAAIIYGEAVPTDRQLPELRERNFGDLDGKPAADYWKVRGAVQDQYDALPLEDRWHFKIYPTIESDHELAGRFVDALTAIAKDNLGKTVLIGTHGGMLRILLIRLGYGTALEYPSGSVKNAAYIELNFDGRALRVVETSNIAKVTTVTAA